MLSILPNLGRGTTRSVVEGHPFLYMLPVPLHHPADGPPPRFGEDLG